MIVCDADNIPMKTHRPTEQVIQEEWRKQTEALKDLRRRLHLATGPRAVGFLKTGG